MKTEEQAENERRAAERELRMTAALAEMTEEDWAHVNSRHGDDIRTVTLNSMLAAKIQGRTYSFTPSQRVVDRVARILEHALPDGIPEP